MNFWSVPGNNVRNDVRVPLNEVYFYQSENLLDALHPARILSVQALASGWDYESYLYDIHLIIR